MLAYCTYCSAQKNQSAKALPAIQLYKSQRITQIAALAKTENAEFLILSGKYGLLVAQQKIDYYDHLLIDSEVEQHASLVASQIKEKKISEIIFYVGSIEQDKNIKAYIDCIEMACQKSGILLKIEAAPFND